MFDTSKATADLFSALSKAQGELENAAKTSSNQHFKSKYADLAEVLNTIRPVFSANGLSLLQTTGFDGSVVCVTTILGHAAGGYITSTASCVPAKTDAQGIGSATTYLRRYSAAAIAGIAQEDDDGQSAAHNDRPAPITRQQPQRQGKPTSGAWESMSAESQAFLSKIATTALQTIKESPADTLDYIESQQLDSEETIALWTRFDSATRAALKNARTHKDAAK